MDRTSYIAALSVLLSFFLTAQSAVAANSAPLAGVGGELPEEQQRAESWKSVQVCFRCHDMSEQTLSKQPRRRQKKHRKALKTQRPCMECHNTSDESCCHDHLFPKIDVWY